MHFHENTGGLNKIELVGNWDGRLMQQVIRTMHMQLWIMHPPQVSNMHFVVGVV